MPKTAQAPADTGTIDERLLLQTLVSFKKGDFSVRMPLHQTGVAGKINDTLNDVIEICETRAREFDRISVVVGKEGRLTQRLSNFDQAGEWGRTMHSTNTLIDGLVQPTTEVVRVIRAVARGDLSQTIPLETEIGPLKGEFLTTAKAINTMVQQLRLLATEVTRVAVDVGTEGKLGGQAQVEALSGTWRELTESVNTMATNLTDQVRDIAVVATAVANGDLSKKITVEVKGEILELKKTLNRMVDQLTRFATEVTRVALDVGTHGKLGGQATVEDVSGTWRELTETVNTMASNLTAHVRDIAQVTTAVANGDLSKKISVEVRGEILELKNTINTMVDRLNNFASEVTRVALDVGTEGKLGGQAEVKGVSGTWRELTESVNIMANNLTDQVRDIAEVATAVANGNLNKKISVEVRGEILELKNTINTMVDQLTKFATEVTRVALDVGTHGKLGGQATVEDVSGTWRELTESVNTMANNLTDQVRDIAQVTTAVANGDLSKTISVEVRGEILELKNTINTMVDRLNNFASEVTRVALDVGTEGKLGGQATVKGVSGTWRELTESVNTMANNLTNQVRDIALVATAVASGNLNKKISVEVRGEILELKNTINTMVDQLRSFASEVTRVALDVGTEGQLGGQATVEGVSGTWRELTESVNTMASNLTDQVRGIAAVVTAVANGNLEGKLSLQAKGEIGALAQTINNMIDTLNTFAGEVTRVARDVGVKGELGGQANVPGASGTWRDLTDNVNELASNLTTQVRAIGSVATAVAKGDLSPTITVEASGEVAELKDNMNRMIRALQETTRINAEQDWLKTNLTNFTRMLQGQRDLASVANLILSELAPLVSGQHGVFYLYEPREENLRLLGSYAYKDRKNLSNRFGLGEGLIGQCALEKQRILIADVPQDYVQIFSGLGSGKPYNIAVLPIIFEGEVQAVIELASFNSYTPIQLNFLEQLTETLGIVLSSIAANTQTVELLRESQAMSQELQSKQLELQQSNEELEEQARLLAEQKAEVELKNQEVEEARLSLQEKADQLALTSKYKSQFLANMSHELRTPLNSLLILARMLADNPDGNLSKKQVEFASTIFSSGGDLLELINEILDLSKIESGIMPVEFGPVAFSDIETYVNRGFAQLAQDKGLEYQVRMGKRLPRSVTTDAKRLKQVLKNLISNAIKFTDEGKVIVSTDLAKKGWSTDNKVLNTSDRVIAFSVRDTGIGIPPDKHQIIFEAFQQVDGGTSRKHGGTGLGLSISREIARLLGGEIQLHSEPGRGATFTLYLPQTFVQLRQEMPVKPRIAEPGLLHDPEPLSVQAALPAPVLREIPDDREQLSEGEPVLLIVEDDEKFASVLRDMARERGFKVLVALRGDAGLELAKQYFPSAILLDLRLREVDGWVVLDKLKIDLKTRHIPVLVLSSDPVPRATKLGAIRWMEKPVSKEELVEGLDYLGNFIKGYEKQLLVVAQNSEQQDSIVDLVGQDGVRTTKVATAADAMEALKAQRFDCIVLDPVLPDMAGSRLIERLRESALLNGIPIVLYASRGLQRREETKLARLSTLVVLKKASSLEQVLAETTLFLHLDAEKLPEEKRAMLQRVQQNGAALEGKQVLVVDDDVRNIFAIMSVLERHKMNVVWAETGQDALTLLKKHGNIDVVLMDIMMPGMDGYETIREIRGMAKYQAVPIIAVTAKAMHGDREKCLEAGASDYVKKPVDTEQLLSLLRVWSQR